MSIWGSLFGNEKIIDGFMSAGDKIVYTNEEKADNHKIFLKLYEPFKIAQRYLAIIFSVPFAFLHTVAFSLRLAMYDDTILQDSVKMIQGDMNDSLGMIVLVVVGFYFAGGAAEGVVRGFVKEK
jgi:hypothetical protein